MSVYPDAQLIWQCHGCATLQGIRFLRQELATMLVTLGMAPDCQQQLLLGISELMTNVVRHAKPSISPSNTSRPVPATQGHLVAVGG